MAELCQFFGGSWKVINNIQQLSQLLCAVNNRGWGLILSKNTSQLKWKGPKKGKKEVFWKIGKSLIVNQPVQLEGWKKRWMCGFSPRIRKNIKTFRKSHWKKNVLKNLKNLFLALFDQIFFFFCDICTLEELLNASGLRKYQKMTFF